jgi:hypothetical protein
MSLLSVGLCKGTRFVPLLPLDTDTADTDTDTAAVETVDRNLLERVWDELDICRIKNGAHIEYLEGI